jgi:hypothetical protein
MERDMEKFIEVLSYLVVRERELAEKIVAEALAHDPQAVLNNAAHDEIQQLLTLCAKLLKDERKQEQNQKPKLRLIK